MAYQQQIDDLATFVAGRTEYTEEEIAENITSDWYIPVEEGLKKGVYHELIIDMMIFFN